MTLITNAIAFLRRYGDSLFYWLVAVIAFSCGMFTANQSNTLQLGELKREYMAQQLQAARAQIIITARLSTELIQARNDILRQAEQLERSIPDAINSDGASYSGLGPDGLQLYKRAFGYNNAGENPR